MSAKRCILVAEDDAGVRDLIRTRLDIAGYEVHTAHNGLEAVARIAALRPGGVILDINMPGLDGFGVLKAMAAQKDAPRSAVLVLTARHSADDVRLAVSLGAKDYLTKPFTESQLLARVGRLFRAPMPMPPQANELML
jgi:DNA-binding response OmpR family regulator